MLCLPIRWPFSPQTYFPVALGEEAEARQATGMRPSLPGGPQASASSPAPKLEAQVVARVRPPSARSSIGEVRIEVPPCHSAPCTGTMRCARAGSPLPLASNCRALRVAASTRTARIDGQCAHSELRSLSFRNRWVGVSHTCALDIARATVSENGTGSGGVPAVHPAHRQMGGIPLGNSRCTMLGCRDRCHLAAMGRASCMHESARARMLGMRRHSMARCMVAQNSARRAAHRCRCRTPASELRNVCRLEASCLTRVLRKNTRSTQRAAGI